MAIHATPLIKHPHSNDRSECHPTSMAKPQRSGRGGAPLVSFSTHIPPSILPAVSALQNMAVFIRNALGHFVTLDHDIEAARGRNRHVAGPDAPVYFPQDTTAWTRSPVLLGRARCRIGKLSWSVRQRCRLPRPCAGQTWTYAGSAVKDVGVLSPAESVVVVLLGKTVLSALLLGASA